MKNNEKTSVKAVAANTPTEKMPMMIAIKGIEEAKIITDQVKPTPNLEETMLIIADLHKQTVQRNRLLVYSDQLEAFDITQKDEDLKETAYYTGCSLKIQDGKRNEFELRNPTLIREVIEFLRNKFVEKMGEIESAIVLPTN